uniref:LOW QUALITY PROTEIN: Kruppel-like factor 18 n=1 Tax=Arvicanthis niloticus TaxID=61156 RepID=UPI001486EE16|nr:LOW QUALITY PROTEIN: Kruppel-like factor 18 [Arvicanthis niloticus]
MPPDSNQTLYGDYVCQTIPQDSNQTIYGGQTMSIDTNQTLYGEMSHVSNQTLYGGETMTHDSNQTLYGEMTTPSGDQTYYTVWMMSLVSSQMPSDDRVLYFPNFHLAPEQPSAVSARFPVVPGNLPDRNDLRTQTQNKGKAYICTYENCGKSFSKSSHLKSHISHHTGEKPYKCMSPGCTWKFFRSDELSCHMRKHTGVTPFECNYCNMAYGRSDHLQGHIKLCH